MFDVIHRYDDAYDFIIEDIMILNEDDDGETTFDQKLVLRYDDTDHDLIPIFKDIFGGVGNLVDLNLLKKKYLRGIFVNDSGLSMIYRIDDNSDELVISLSFDAICESLDISYFTIGVYHYLKDKKDKHGDPEMVEAYDIYYNLDEDEIKVEIALPDDETKEYYIPLWDCDENPLDIDDPDDE